MNFFDVVIFLYFNFTIAIVIEISSLFIIVESHYSNKTLERNKLLGKLSFLYQQKFGFFEYIYEINDEKNLLEMIDENAMGITKTLYFNNINIATENWNSFDLLKILIKYYQDDEEINENCLPD